MPASPPTLIAAAKAADRTEISASGVIKVTVPVSDPELFRAEAANRPLAPARQVVTIACGDPQKFSLDLHAGAGFKTSLNKAAARAIPQSRGPVLDAQRTDERRALLARR
jgi:hypothetical protein